MEENKVWAVNDKGVKILSLSDKQLPIALKLMRESYYTDEPVANAVNIQEFPEAIDELEKLTLITYDDGVSLVALEDDQIVGVSFNKIQHKVAPGQKGFFENFRDDVCKTGTSKDYMNLMIEVDSKNDIYKNYSVDTSMEIMFVATCKNHRNKGIGKLLIATAEEVARSKGIPLCSAICSNIYTLKICNSLKWDQLITVNMSEITHFNGNRDKQHTLTLVGQRVGE